MRSPKHPFDIAAEQMEIAADAPVRDQSASTAFWELRSAADVDVVGDYPQTEPCDEEIPLKWGDSEGLGADGFPVVPFPDQKLRSSALRTDVMKAGIPAAWSIGQIFNDKALSVFKRFDLGTFKEYRAKVIDGGGNPQSMTYLHIRNVIDPSAIDFCRSVFLVVDMIGMPLGTVDVDSFDDWVRKTQLAQQGKLAGGEEFSMLDFKTLRLLPGRDPTADYFTLARLGTSIYVSGCLKDAIEQSGLSGLEIKSNKRLFASYEVG